MYLFIISWLSTLPFIHFGGSYEGPKVFWFWGGGFVLSLYWINRLIRNTSLSLKSSDFLFLFWIVLLSVSSLIGVHPVQSIIGGSYRHQGVLFFITLFLVSLTIPVLKIGSRQLLYRAMLAGSVLESLLILYEKLFMNVARPIGTFGEPNAVAGFLSVSLYFILYEKRISVLVKGLLYFIVALTIVATGSRTGLIVSLFILLGPVISYFVKRKNNAVHLGLILGVVASLGISAYSYVKVVSILRPVSTFENRSEFWQTGVGELKKSPVFGYGAESLEFVYDRAYKRISFPLADLIIDRSHNIFLDVALWSGFVGLCVFLSWLASILYRGILNHDYHGTVALLAWLLFACFQPVGVVQWLLLILITTKHHVY